MSAITNTTVGFEAAAEFEDGETIVLNPARPTKADAVRLGYTYFTVSNDDAAMDALLDEFGPVFVRRALRTFGNHAKRDGQKEVAAYTEMLRDEIQVIYPTKQEEVA